MHYKIQQRKLKLNFTHCETSTATTSPQNHPHSPSAPGIAEHSMEQGTSGTCRSTVPQPAKEAPLTRTGVCLTSWATEHRGKRRRQDCHLRLAFIKNAENQINAICFRSNETFLFYLGFCMFVQVLTPKTLLYICQELHRGKWGVWWSKTPKQLKYFISFDQQNKNKTPVNYLRSPQPLNAFTNGCHTGLMNYAYCCLI